MAHLSKPHHFTSLTTHHSPLTNPLNQPSQPSQSRVALWLAARSLQPASPLELPGLLYYVAQPRSDVIRRPRSRPFCKLSNTYYLPTCLQHISSHLTSTLLACHDFSALPSNSLTAWTNMNIHLLPLVNKARRVRPSPSHMYINLIYIYIPLLCLDIANSHPPPLKQPKFEVHLKASSMSLS